MSHTIENLRDQIEICREVLDNFEKVHPTEVYDYENIKRCIRHYVRTISVYSEVLAELRYANAMKVVK